MIRILLVDDQKLIRECLKVLLEQEPDLDVIAIAGNGKDAIKLARELKPDVALIDIEMPDLDGLSTTQLICQEFNDIKILILSSHDDERYVSQALRVGAKGYLLKSTPATELGNSIRSVYKGYAQIGPGLFEKIMPYVPELTVFTEDSPVKTIQPSSALAIESQNLSLPTFNSQYSNKLAHQTHQQEQLASLEIGSTVKIEQISWRKFLGFVLISIGLTASIYAIRQHLRQPIPSLSRSEQLSTIATTEFTGKVQPAKTLKMAATIPGVVENIYVKIGDRVELGQSLLALKNPDAAKGLKQLEQQKITSNEQKQLLLQQQQLAAQQVTELQQKIDNFERQLSPLRDRLATADLQVALVENRSEQSFIPQKQQTVERTKAIYANAVNNHKRLQELYTQGIVSQYKVEEAQSAIEVAKADLNIAKADLNSAKKQASKNRELESVRSEKSQLQLQAALKQKQTEIEQLQQQLKQARLNDRQATERINLLDRQSLQLAKVQTPELQTIIKATSVGVISELPVAIGSQVYTDNTLVVLTQMKELKAEISVNARIINGLKVGQPATVTILTGLGSQEFIGKIVTINPIPSENLSHTVEVQFANPTDLLLIGQPAKVHFPLK
jgi:hemolysin D